MYMQAKPLLQLAFRQRGEDLVCYLPADRQILFPYGNTSCAIGRCVASVYSTCHVVSRIEKADQDPEEVSLSASIKENERPCLALARLLKSLSKVSDALKVHEDHIVFYKATLCGHLKDSVRESVGEYYSQRDSGGRTVRNMYRVTT